MDERIVLLALAIGFLILGPGCVNSDQSGNTSGTNITTYPPGYEAADYCERDSDCYRQIKCCDCGDGEYVNKYHLATPSCAGPKCLCPISDTKGACNSHKCMAVPQTPPVPDNTTKKAGFCGWSTNGPCKSDAECTIGGCSSQVCQSKSEPPVATTCEFAECYNAEAYGALCSCVAGKCNWQ